MRTVKEQEILTLAPNANAVSNARKISSGNGFVVRKKSADDTFYMGECKGSGKKNYVVSADYIDEEHPVFRCSCPSRQFPCKHSLALLFEMAAGKDFKVDEIPEDILEKRQKKEAREAKKKSEGDKKPVSEKSAKAAKAAKTKKIKKQLEGLALMKQLLDNLMDMGLAAMGSVSLKTYRDLSKQLGDYYLPGPLLLFNRLILEMEAFQKDQDTEHYKKAVEILKRLRTLERKANVYLNDKLEHDSPEADDDELYEELGGIWKLEQLNDLGLKKENAKLLQLSFSVSYDEARKEYIDLGYWIDVDSGEIFHTCNYRPVKALKHVKQEDSCFSLMNISTLTYYPGTVNRRVRWSGATFEDVEEHIYKQIIGKAYGDFGTMTKAVKNYIKNTLAEDYFPVMAAYEEIGTVSLEGKQIYVMMDIAGNRIELRKKEGWQDTVSMMPMLPNSVFFNKGAIFGLIYYDTSDRQICMHPCSMVKEQGILRLLY